MKDLFGGNSNFRPQRKSNRHEEHNIQSSCHKLFNLMYPQHRGKLFAIPNGAMTESVKERVRAKQEGVISGVADMQLIIANNGYNGLFIEFKTPKGKQSDNQKLWQSIAETENYKYVICRSVSDFKQILIDYIGKPKHDIFLI